jgi:signal transduction histidine kinase
MDPRRRDERGEARVSGPLRVLIVEDSDEDEALVLRELRRAGYTVASKRAQTSAEFRAALQAGPWDVVISDHSLPSYTGLAALAELRESGKDIPFILVSGTIGESVAVTAMKAGAQDYVLKGDLTRLPAAVEREVREMALRAEQRRMREQLVISERMASAGMLAAGVAHEINNPLAIAVANLDYATEFLARRARTLNQDESPEADKDPPADDGSDDLAALDEPLRDAREALQRIRDIVRDVKLFSRPEDDAMRSIDVQQVLDSSIRMAWNEIRHRANLVKSYGPVPRIRANESRLGQVLLNILVNAAQAIPEGTADRNEIRVTTGTSRDGSAYVEVRDTGCGIPKEHLDRIFDAFFTTKPVGEGTGLGLAICYRIVAELGGRIEIESQVGQGTLFRLVFPAASGDAPSEAAPVVFAPSTRRGRVLVVDDEEAMGRALERSLRAHHDVVVVHRARDALALVADGERFDALIADVMMPEVGGVELHERLAEIAPDQRARMIFVTGGAFTVAAREFLDRAGRPTLEKPVDVAALLRIVAGMMGTAGAA